MGVGKRKSWAERWAALGVGGKAAMIMVVFVVVIGGVLLPLYQNCQDQQALILAEQQEQERIAAEQAEAERIAAEEQARLEQEAQAEAERLAAEAEAARLKADRIEQERIAAEEEQVRLEAEAQAEAERIAAEEAAAEQANQQAEAQVSQSSIALETSGAATTTATGEPTSGERYELAKYYNAVWDAEKAGWVYTTEYGITYLILAAGGTETLSAPEPTHGEGLRMARNHYDAIWVPELEGWVYQMQESKTVVLIFPSGNMEYMRGEREELGLRYLK